MAQQWDLVRIIIIIVVIIILITRTLILTIG
jgi:hypothetical protein